MSDEPRIYTVEARCKLAIAEALLEIQPSNGYNTAVNHVHRRRDIARTGDDPPEIFLWFGVTRSPAHASRSTDGIISKVLDARIWYFNTVPEGDLDLESDLFAGDIMRRLHCFSLYETRGGMNKQVLNYYKNSKGAYFQAQAQEVLGYLDYEFHYRHVESDPRLWDSITDVLVPIL